jgi:glyoxylase-like metal-dependent hydrolase (beta-lactamase superfamily II)
MRYRIGFAALLVAALGIIAQSQAQTAPPAKPAPPQAPAMTVQHIGGPLYLVKGGSGANTAFYVGAEAVIAIDAKMTADAARQMLAEIGKVTPLPVKFLIISHSDGDHVNGLTGFPRDLTIISSAGTKKEMEEAFQGEKFAEHRTYLPNKAFEHEFDLTIKVADGKTVDINLRHDVPAHTSGDTVIVFPEEKAAFIGDLAFIGRDPLIHRQKGGTVFGYLDTLKKMIALDNIETYLSGHADPLSKADLKTLLAALEEKVAKVKAMIDEGKTLDEIKAAFGVAPSAAGSPSRFPSFVENVYLELTEKK